LTDELASLNNRVKGGLGNISAVKKNGSGWPVAGHHPQAKRMFPNQFNNLERKSARQIRVQRSVQ
jgi:hypothetical protein